MHHFMTSVNAVMQFVGSVLIIITSDAAALCLHTQKDTFFVYFSFQRKDHITLIVTREVMIGSQTFLLYTYIQQKTEEGLLLLLSDVC